MLTANTHDPCLPTNYLIQDKIKALKFLNFKNSKTNNYNLSSQVSNSQNNFSGSESQESVSLSDEPDDSKSESTPRTSSRLSGFSSSLSLLLFPTFLVGTCC